MSHFHQICHFPEPLLIPSPSCIYDSAIIIPSIFQIFFHPAPFSLYPPPLLSIISIIPVPPLPNPYILCHHLCLYLTHKYTYISIHAIIPPSPSYQRWNHHHIHCTCTNSTILPSSYLHKRDTYGGILLPKGPVGRSLFYTQVVIFSPLVLTVLPIKIIVFNPVPITLTPSLIQKPHHSYPVIWKNRFYCSQDLPHALRLPEALQKIKPVCLKTSSQ